jgi:hypothetical protein
MSFPPDPTMQGPVGPPPGPMGPPPGPGFNGPPPQPPSSGSNPALIVGILVLVVGLIAAGAFVLLSGDDEKEGEGEEASSRDRTEQSDDDQNEDCAALSAPGQEEDGEGQSQDGGGSEGSGNEGSGSGQAEDGCAPDVPTDVEVPDVEVPEVEVPDVDVTEVEVPEVDVPEDDTSDVPSSSSDVVMTFAEDIYANTPGGVSQDDAICLASAVIAVVGESTVEAAGYDPGSIYGSTSTSDDAEIASLAYTCTSSAADQALADEVGPYWPDPWNPTS